MLMRKMVQLSINVVLLGVVYLICGTFAEDDIENCLCTDRNLCVLPFYQINAADNCSDSSQTCCSRVEWSEVKCGQDAELHRILTGLHTNPSEVPWTTVITKVREPEHQLLGAGSLIHPGVVLTAAHVVDKVDKAKLEVRVGAFDLNPTSAEQFSERRRVSRVIKHSLFSASHLTNDIALLILSSPLTLNNKIKTLCLPEQGTNFDTNSCVFAGWGKDPTVDKDEAQSQLKKADLYVLPRRQCEEDLRRSRHFASWLHLHSGFLCTIGETPTQRPCKGDGGSPLFCWNDAGEFYEQAGIASWGADCEDSDVTPAVFTNVAKYRDWIDDILGQLTDGLQKHKL